MKSTANVYTDGEGEGFGNKISIQTVDVVIAATAAGRVYEFGQKGQVRTPAIEFHIETNVV